MATKRKYIGPKGSRIKNGLGSSEAAGIQVKSGPSSNLAQAAKLKSQANSINAKYGRNRFQVGAGMLNQAVAPGGLTKAGKVTKAQVKAARQTAKNILGSKEGGSKGSKGKKKR
jgi:ribosomal protein S30